MYFLIFEMESSSGRELVTIARLGKGAVLREDSEVEQYIMTNELIDYQED